MSSSLSDITLVEFASDWGSFGEFKGSHCVVKDGFERSIALPLAAGLDVRLQHEVVKIDSTDPIIQGKGTTSYYLQC
jgi:hypothetical protein